MPSKTCSSSSWPVRIMTAVCGRRSLISRVALMPSILGMEISIRTTSGSSLRHSATPSWPSKATPTTSTPGSMSTRPDRPLVKSRWSSTTATRMFSSSPLLKNLTPLSLEWPHSLYSARCLLMPLRNAKRDTLVLFKHVSREDRLQGEFRPEPLNNPSWVIRLSDRPLVTRRTSRTEIQTWPLLANTYAVPGWVGLRPAHQLYSLSLPSGLRREGTLKPWLSGTKRSEG